ncbi:thioesterase family protein (plasmid) [Rahnella aquatilis]|nr:thioesterase family protein [Rahnella aquatilis]
MAYCYLDEIKMLQTLLANHCEEGKKISPAVKELLDRSVQLQRKALALLADAFVAYEKRTGEEDCGEFEEEVNAQLCFLQQFDEINAHKEKQERDDYAEMEVETQWLSDLPPSGFTDTSVELHRAAGQIVAQARQRYGLKPLTASVWAFRYNDFIMLSCDLATENKNEPHMPITITASGRLELSTLDEPDVFDMAEAMHLVGLITRALGAKVEIGRGANEVNPEVLASPLKEGQTNGAIDLWPL